MSTDWWSNPIAQELSKIEGTDRDARFDSVRSTFSPKISLNSLRTIQASRNVKRSESWMAYAQSHSAEVQELMDRFESGDVTVVDEVATMLRSGYAHPGIYNGGGRALGSGQQDWRLNQLRAQQLLATQAYLRTHEPISPATSRDLILGERPPPADSQQRLFDAAFRAVIAVGERENTLLGYTAVVQRTGIGEVHAVANFLPC